MVRARHARLAACAAALVAFTVPAQADPYGHYGYHAPPFFGYSPYGYPFPYRDGDAIFDINCRDGIQILKLQGFRVVDIVRCKMRKPFVYIAVSEGRRYRVTVSTLDGEIISAVPADAGKARRGTRNKRRRK